MKTQVNIFTPDWCNLVFEGKNKNYGAYELRQMSAKRHVLALLLSISIFVLGVSAPLLLKSILPPRPNANTDETILTNVTIDKPEDLKPPEDLPIPEMRRTIQFTAPVITNNDVNDDETPIIDNLLNSTAAIASITQEGSDNPEIPVPNFSLVEKEPDPVPFVEKMPEFPGGELARIQFLKENIKYPSIATEMGISGRVILQFVVDKYGKISNIKVLRGIGGGCDEEAIRVAKLMPAWKPGSQNGRNVPVYFTFPIVFALQNQ